MSLVFSSIALSANQTILIISDTGSKIHSQVVTELQNLDFSTQATIDSSYADDITADFLSHNDFSLIISLGYQAALLANQSNSTTLNALLPQQSVADRKLCITAECPNLGQHYSIYLDQPVARQFNLINAILPQIKTVGVLTADFSAGKLALLKEEADKRHWQLINRTIEDVVNLNHQFNKLIKQSNVILALPDPQIHNRETVPYLLLTSYRYNIPFIGFSKAYVNAGAIAAVFSSPKQIAQHIWELAEEIVKSNNNLHQKVYPPKYFSVSTNRNVARSLDIRLDDNEQIKLKLLQMEK